MPGKSLTAAEKEALPTLDHAIPNCGQKGNTHPFNVGQRVFKYHPDELSKAASDSPRTDWFAKHIYVIWKETGAPVPYAFRTRDGTIRSLDAGCLGHLLKRHPPEIEIAAYDVEGRIAAVRPSASLAERCELIGVEGLRNTLGIAERENGAANSGAALAATIELTFDISAPVDERRKEESERTIREGARVFKEALMLNWNRRCAITGTAVASALDGAHIYRYLGPKTNHPTNGLLLRADVHRLFDKHLLSLRYEGGRLAVVCSSLIAASEYAGFQDVALPNDPAAWPDPRLIGYHYSLFLAREKRRLDGRAV